MIAILSDIHGNLEALQAVMEDVRRREIETIICLGDIIGYGPDPIACLNHAMDWSVVLQGHFEHAVLDVDVHAEHWPPTLRKMLKALGEQLRTHPRGEQLMAFLSARPSYVVRDIAMFVHGSPRRSVHEYIFPEAVFDSKMMESIWECFEILCFCGHTHLPGVFTRGDRGSWDYVTPDDCDGRFPVTQKLLCNVGSVGQPRDDDPRACYVTFHGDTICFHRLEYDWDLTGQKIRDKGDDPIQGDRLRGGR